MGSDGLFASRRQEPARFGDGVLANGRDRRTVLALDLGQLDLCRQHEGAELTLGRIPPRTGSGPGDLEAMVGRPDVGVQADALGLRVAQELVHAGPVIGPLPCEHGHAGRRRGCARRVSLIGRESRVCTPRAEGTRHPPIDRSHTSED